MLRDNNLIPLSRQHQHALALCVRLDRAIRAGDVDLEAWQVEIQQQFESEIEVHFAVEEKLLFPAAAQFPDLQALIQQLLTEHSVLRDYFARAAGIYEAHLGPHNTRLGVALDNLGQTLTLLKQFAAARSTLERALAIQTQELGARHPWTGNVLQSLAKLASDPATMHTKRPSAVG